MAHIPKPGRGLWTAMLVVASIACDETPVKGSEVSTARMTDEELCLVQYGYDQSGKLTYIVFVSESLPTSGVNGLVSQDAKGHYLTKPDGGRVDLPSEHLLFESINGKFRELKVQNPLTKDDVEAFFDSAPKRYTIDAFLSFCKTKRKYKSE